MKRYPKNYKQSAVMPLLDLAQRQVETLISDTSSVWQLSHPCRDEQSSRDSGDAAREGLRSGNVLHDVPHVRSFADPHFQGEDWQVLHPGLRHDSVHAVRL